jgi:hypothetical protein
VPHERMARAAKEQRGARDERRKRKGGVVNGG